MSSLILLKFIACNYPQVGGPFQYPFLFTVLFFLCPVTPSQGNKYRVAKRVVCRNGAVVSANSLASQAGLQMLIAGGNAIDAAIATQLALAVVYPGAGNLGGGGFMVAHLSNQKNLAIDFREKAPASAGRNMYLDSL